MVCTCKAKMYVVSVMQRDLGSDSAIDDSMMYLVYFRMHLR